MDFIRNSDSAGERCSQLFDANFARDLSLWEEGGIYIFNLAFIYIKREVGELFICSCGNTRPLYY